MADIRLQDYVAKVKELIRSVRLDEAIAHCQHILRHYPKHVETYSLLGEACLEKQMYREAIEFFQRTLGADPENLMARVGLGVIYDEQGAFPEAIWQLERAFELVPGNSEVRRELLRLYGQYDGIDKTRLKLTRGALGRLYSRNGLYERAIGEFHAVLRQDPELPDIRVALVEALWREGRQLEAVETCMELLDALPNCLKANLILGEIWLRGGNEDSAEERLSVARALDPENLVAQELMGSDSPLPLEDVFIPELDAIPDEFDLAPPSVPGAGVVVAAEAAEVVAAEAPDEEDMAPWGTDEELPVWLRDVGVTAEEPPLEMVADEPVLEPPPDEALPAEDIPEWLQEVMGEEGVAPAGEPPIVEGEVPEEEFAGEEESPELLQESDAPDLAGAGLAAGAAVAAGLMVAGMADDEDQGPPEDEPPSEAIPEWLEELVTEAETSEGEEPVS
ncbi:MAG: tetratricopeptide repeat protein, partial [Anaerolineae bacterium]|nr:tetratricopeptide repeat protein [Anaerolineae bacterium]